MKVCVPMWFKIKANASVINSANHIYKRMIRSCYLPSEFQKIVLPAIQKNGYFTSPENFLLAMVNDKAGLFENLS